MLKAFIFPSVDQKQIRLHYAAWILMGLVSSELLVAQA
jgi:hypothetical protein